MASEGAGSSTKDSSPTDNTTAAPDRETEPTSRSPQQQIAGAAIKSPYVVGIGASAGGLKPLQEFFGAMPQDSGLAFVIVQQPEFKSLMSELLSRHTSMALHRVEHGMPLEADSIYLIPPKKNLAISDDKLLLTDQDLSRGQPVNFPIDIFFNSLAESLGERAIGVVLSGTGSDGTRGVRSINESGGVVLVQDPESAEFDGMPRSVIGTGMADYVLRPRELARAIYDYVTSAPGGLIKSDAMSELDATLQEITKIVARGERIDFSHYKPSTLGRRIERRRVISGCGTVDEYVQLLEDSSEERAALRNDLLINVTGFFRDPESWAFLERQIIPQMIAQTKESEELRIWVTACSSGEEAYSLAMLVQEGLEAAGRSMDVKIFATDIDETVLAKAGTGIYPASLIDDISPQRVARFFKKKGLSYQVARGLREMMIFAQHNLARDPPFTRMHLATCRNLLIYMQQQLQHQVLSTLHFSLQVKGVLFLGAAESVGDLDSEFATLHQKWKVFEKRRDVKLPLRGGEGLLVRALHTPRLATDSPDAALGRRLEAMASEAFGEFLRNQSALCLLATPDHELLQVFGDSRNFLRVPEGKSPMDVTKLVPKPLSLPLSTALHRARMEKKAVSYSGMKIERGDDTRCMDMHVSYHAGGSAWPEFLMVLFKDAGPAVTVPADQYDVDSQAAQRIADLENDLQQTKENLQATIEELETTNEEQQATNQEMLASNEELQSTNEELQSVNEELYSVNAEYQSKIQELTDPNNDMDNLLSSTDIGTVFLDKDLQIRKFTPAVTEVIKLQDHDVGRPIDQIAYGIDMDHDDLLAQAKRVLESGEPSEFNVESHSGSALLMRVNPYRDDSDRTDGVVLTFVDVSKLKQAEEAVRESEELVRTIAENSTQALVMMDDHGYCTYCNTAWLEMTGYDIEEICSKPLHYLVHHHYPDGRTYPIEDCPIDRALPENFDVRAHEDLFFRKDGSTFPVLCAASPIFKDGKPCSTVLEVRDMGDFQDAKEAQRASEERLRLAAKAAGFGTYDMNLTKGEVFWSPELKRILGLPEDAPVTVNAGDVPDCVHPQDRSRVAEAILASFHPQGDGEFDDEHRIVRPDGEIRWVHFRGRTLFEGKGAKRRAMRASGTVTDITERKRDENDRARLAAIVQSSRDAIIAKTIDGKITSWNAAAERIYGYSADEAIGRPVSMLLPPDRPGEVAELLQRLKRGEPIEDFETVRQTKDGRKIDVSLAISPLYNAKGRTVGAATIARDITQRKRDEFKLRLLQSVTEAIGTSRDFESAMGDALILICETIGWDYGEAWVPNADRSALERSLNPYMTSERLEPFARSGSEIALPSGQGLPGHVWSSREPVWFLDVSSKPPQEFLRADVAAEVGLKGGFAVPIIADGEVLAVLSFFMMSEPRQEDLSLVIDLVHSVACQLGSVVQRKSIDAELQSAYAELEKKNQHLEQFVHTVSHDLKSPLVTIGGMLGMLKDELQEGRLVDAGEMIATGEETVGRMQGLIDDLLKLSRLGRVVSNLHSVELQPLIEEVVCAHQAEVEQQHATVGLTLDVANVPANRNRLAEVLDNLLVNALKYACDGREPRIEIGSETADGEVRLFVRDNGPGIEPQQHENIFGLFQQLDTTREGSGVGLAIVRRIMEVHHGRAWVESNVGQGATFWLAFPSQVAEAASIH